MRLEIKIKKLPRTKKIAALEKHTGKKKTNGRKNYLSGMSQRL